MLKEAKFHSYQRNNNMKNVGSESSDNNLFDPVEPLIDWATTPLFLNVLNSSHEWNQRGDSKIFYPLEIDYVIDMIKQSFAEFKQSDMIKPFYVKAK